MAKFCSWCGKQFGFFDIDFTYEEVGDKGYHICGECSGKITAAKNGNITFEEIRTDRTNKKLFNHLLGETEPTDEMKRERKIRQEQQQIKKDAQQTNPLYDDIHQIARDLRFIKNYLIFSIVVGVIVGFIWLVNVL